MQQGICTIDNGKIIFMNDLCNKFTSELSGLLDFEQNLNQMNQKAIKNPLERKIFYSFDQGGNEKAKHFKSNQTDSLS